jgi:hypothetical protein
MKDTCGIRYSGTIDGAIGGDDAMDVRTLYKSPGVEN